MCWQQWLIRLNRISGMVKQIHGSYKIQYHPDGPEGEPVEIDFTPPFKRVNMLPTLEQVLNVKFPSAEEIGTDVGNKFLSDLCAAKGKYLLGRVFI